MKKFFRSLYRAEDTHSNTILEVITMTFIIISGIINIINFYIAHWR